MKHGIIAIEAVQSDYLANQWEDAPYLQPEHRRFPVLHTNAILPSIYPLTTPSNPLAEEYYFCAQLLFVQTLAHYLPEPIQIVSGYWDNFLRLFRTDGPDDGSAVPADLTLVLDFDNIKGGDDINTRLYWRTFALRNPTIKFLAVNEQNWRIVLVAEMEKMPGNAGI